MTLTCSFKNSDQKLQASHPVVIELIQTIGYYFKKMKRSHYQLNRIAQQFSGTNVGNKAATFLKKQNKLLAIANDLQSKLMNIDSFESHLSPELKTDLIKQYALELDLLNDMHFAVAKTYHQFIFHYFEPRVVEASFMAA